MSKPTMQDIANKLSTSRITVWKALNNRPGVSDALRRRIQQTAEEMGYYHTPAMLADPAAPKAERSHNIAVAVCRPESSLFWMQIIHQIAKDLAAHDVNLIYTYLPTSYKEGYSLPTTLTDGTVEGVIVLNTYAPPVLQLLSNLPLPKIYLDTIPAMPYDRLHGDLLMIEGRDLVRQITGRLLDRGYNRLGFIGDVEYAQTNSDRYLGFLDAFAQRGMTPNPAYCLTGSLGLRTHYEEIGRFLDSLDTMPDGFVCVSDYIAHFVQRYFDESAIDPEGHIILTGFDNNAEYTNVANRISTVDVQPRTIGARLAAKILFNVSHPNAAHEVSYVTSDILYRGQLSLPTR